MPNFKQKNVKQIIVNEKNNTTLNGKHNDFVNKFKKDENEIIPEYENEISFLENSLNDIKNEIINLNNCEKKQQNKNEKLILKNKQIEIEERIKKIKNKIKKINNSKKEYYLNNSKHIFDYFEQKKNLEEGHTKTRLLNDFFKIKKNNKDESDKCSDALKEYLKNVDNTFLDINEFVIPQDICNDCRKGELIAVEHDGVMICNNCSKSFRFLVENEKPSYKEPPKEVCFYAYKRINHFREVLAQFQAKETTYIPDEVLEAIKQQAKKERLPLTEEWFDNNKAKEMLKKLGLNKYYEHIPYIKDKLGIRPPVMSPELEEVLCNLFMLTQAPFSKYCPDVRVNFINYYYTGYKLCELVDQKQFLPYFPMLKDDDKLKEQDELWKKICEDLGWTFIPTVRPCIINHKSLWDLNSDWDKLNKN